MTALWWQISQWFYVSVSIISILNSFLIAIIFLVGSEEAQNKANAAKLAAKVANKKKGKKSGFAKDLADINHKNIRQSRYVKNSDRNEKTKGRGAKKGNAGPGKSGSKGKTGKVNKRKGRR